MNEAKYLRKNNVIRDVEGNIDRKFDSINKAKAESRRLQITENGQLGKGSVRVVEKLPPLKKGEAAPEEAGHGKNVLLSGKLNSPYGFMTIGMSRYYNGHPVIDRKLTDVYQGHLVPIHWIAR
jgi:hypothetical protein